MPKLLFQIKEETSPGEKSLSKSISKVKRQLRRKTFVVSRNPITIRTIIPTGKLQVTNLVISSISPVCTIPILSAQTCTFSKSWYVSITYEIFTIAISANHWTFIKEVCECWPENVYIFKRLNWFSKVNKYISKG